MADTLRERFEDAIRPWKTNPALSVSDIVLAFVRAERRRFAERVAIKCFEKCVIKEDGENFAPGPIVAAAEAEDA